MQQTLNAKAQLQLTVSPNSERAKELQQELGALDTELGQLRAKIRQNSPHYAALTQPQPLSLAEIQQTLDAETVLLEFALGEERSYLWAVTKDALASYELPPQAQINNAALELQRLLTARGVRVNGETLLQQRTRLERADSQLPAAARALSQLLLAPIAERLRKDWAKRTLLVVADGALQYVPFAMLPAPEESGRVGDGATGGRGDGASQSAIRNPQSAIKSQPHALRRERRHAGRSDQPVKRVAVDAFERTKSGLLADGSPFRFLAVTVLFGDIAQRIEPADAAYDGGEQVGALCHGATDSDATGGPAANREAFVRRVFLGDEFFAHGDEIAPGVRFVLKLTGLVPFATVFAAAADIGETDDSAFIDESEEPSKEEGRVSRRAIRAVGRDPGWIEAV